MADDRFGDGAVVERIGDVFAVARLVRRVVDHHVDQDVLSVVDFLFLDTDERAQPQIFNANNGVGLTERHQRFSIGLIIGVQNTRKVGK